MLSIYLLDKNETKKWWLPAISFSWTKDLYGGDSGQINISYQVVKDYCKKNLITVKQLLSDALRKVVIFDEIQEKVIFKGVITGENLSGATLGDLQISLSFADPRVLLAKRLTESEQTYTEEKLETVVQNLINSLGNLSDLGISVGALPETQILVTRKYKYNRIWDALMGLSALKMKNGFEFDFDANWQLNFAAETIGEIKKNIVFDDHNILNFSNRLNLASTLTNRVYVKGKGDSPVEVLQDPIAQTYWGIQETYLSATDLETPTDLQDRAEAYLRENCSPQTAGQIQISVLGHEPIWHNYNVGDWLKININQLDLNQMLRLTKRVIAYENKTMKLDLTLSQQNTNQDFLSDYKEMSRRLERLEMNQ